MPAPRNLTTSELIRIGLDSDNPLAAELAARLAGLDADFAHLKGVADELAEQLDQCSGACGDEDGAIGAALAAWRDAP